jgi:protoporphyrinogen oxidase
MGLKGEKSKNQIIKLYIRNKGGSWVENKLVDMKNSTVVLGAGITGLAAAWKISKAKKAVIVVEKDGRLGGLASSFRHGEFTLDYGPHKIYTQMPSILKVMKALLGDELLEVEKKSSIRIQGKYLSYPFVPSELLLRLNPITGIKCGLSYFQAVIENKISAREDKTYEDFIVKRFGKETYRLVFEPYARKVWGDPKKLDAELARVRIAVPSMLELVKRTFLGDSNKREISAKTFFYPKKGIIEMSDRMGGEIRKNGGVVLTHSSVKEIRLGKNKIQSILVEKDGVQSKIEPETVISTLPIGLAISMMRPKPPAKVLEAARNLKYRSLILVYLITSKRRVMRDCWIFYPEKEFIFNRLSEQK